ncbi:uncharacterized protein LOC6534123 [Drosophila yakuba]|uniref:Uncharacterized protein n=1 Tax=Drosophila yakuba TaxID=7245 RepID=B4PIG2_DROYA|nr:uncharacterized protein LOC6534123 [Drosophila yakuba]EDW94519.1 uncharacterized protein Dyak_GE20008 [Drosophila yakuba]
MSSSEIDLYAELQGFDLEEIGPLSFAPGPMSPNQNLETSLSDLVSPSVSITSVDGSQVSGSGESNIDPETRLFGLRSVRGTTNLIPPGSVRSTPSPLPAWEVVRRRLSSNPSTLSIPEESSRTYGQLRDNSITLLEAMGNRRSIREAREMNRRISEFMQDVHSYGPTEESFRIRRRRSRAAAIARAHARTHARRLRAGSLNERSLAQPRDAVGLPLSLPAQVLRRGNSVSDCSQCSSDEEQNKIEGKNRKPTVPSHLTEWLYPI